VTITDEFTPFLYPNLYCWYTGDSKAVQYGMELSDESTDDLDYVERVYHYVTENIVYDTELAANAPLDYLPDIDATMDSGKGICFDYAALMTAMLRSQGIPTKLEVGYSGQVYHAWISVYLEEKGWVDNIISFDGNSWSLMDPTLAASNSASSVKKYVGDGSNYTVKYYY
jgi:transglutaminase-like putative cysteine protease